MALIEVGIGGMLTSLWRAEVFTWRWGPWSASPSFLNAQSATFDVLTLETFLCCIRLIGSNHFHKAEATGLLGVWIFHDGTSLNFTVLLEHAHDVLLVEARMDASNKEI